jgi:membrane protein
VVWLGESTVGVAFSRVRERVGDWTSWARHTPVGLAIHRFNHFRGTRLAGTVTFYGFLSVFPLLVLGFSVALRVVGTDGVAQLEGFVEQYVPGIADELRLQEVRSSAASLQVVGVITLLVTGLGWVDATRASVRSMWGLPDRDGNLLVRKLVDLVALAGLGALVALSLIASTWVSGQGERLLRWMNQDSSTAGLLVSNLLAQALALITASLLVGYILSGLPRILMQWRVLLPAALVGGLALEILKRLLIGYISGFAGNSTYGAFGAPVALLVWIYVVARLLMVIAAWTAERSDAPLVQPRFIEAAAAMRAAGDTFEAKKEEEWEAEHFPSTPADSTPGTGARSRRRDMAVAAGAGVALGMVLRRRR